VAIYTLIKHLLAATTGTPFLCRPTSAAAADHNPQLAGNVTLDGDFDMLTAQVNTANKFSVTLKGMGAPTFTEA
jgi:hypothetical protein